MLKQVLLFIKIEQLADLVVWLIVLLTLVVSLNLSSKSNLETHKLDKVY